MITAGEKSVGESAPFRVICMCVYDKPGISRKTNGKDGDEDKKKRSKDNTQRNFFPLPVFNKSKPKYAWKIKIRKANNKADKSGENVRPCLYFNNINLISHVQNGSVVMTGGCQQ